MGPQRLDESETTRVGLDGFGTGGFGVYSAKVLTFFGGEENEEAVFLCYEMVVGKWCLNKRKQLDIINSLYININQKSFVYLITPSQTNTQKFDKQALLLKKKFSRF